MEEVNEYTVIREYKGRVIELKVSDYVIDGKRSTIITCDNSTGFISLNNATDVSVDDFIEKAFQFSIRKVSHRNLVKKIKNYFK